MVDHLRRKDGEHLTRAGELIHHHRPRVVDAVLQPVDEPTGCIHFAVTKIGVG
jgi:hypothetical protein